MSSKKSGGPVSKANLAMAILNETYAICVVGGKTAIIVENADGFELWTKQAFIDHLLAATPVPQGDKMVPLSQCFLRHPDTRRYSGICFAPEGNPAGFYNAWRGFSVESRKGSWHHFKDHLHSNVCRGDPDLFAWLMGWFAHIIQHPGKKVGTALALVGKTGTGKTIVGVVFGALFKAHYLLVDNPELVTGRFNAHMARLILLHADEAFFAGDKSVVGRLRSLVTASELAAEYKGRDAVKMRSCVRLLITSEQPRAVPASYGERRFAVLDVGTARQGDTEYFGAMLQEMDNGGREALMYDLLHFDLDSVDLRKIPQTDALIDQKLRSADSCLAFWHDCLERGTALESSDGWESSVNKMRVHEAYVRFANASGDRHPLTPELFSKHLKDMCGSADLTPRVRENGVQRRHYGLPNLAKARQELDNYIGSKLRREGE